MMPNHSRYFLWSFSSLLFFSCGEEINDLDNSGNSLWSGNETQFINDFTFGNSGDQKEIPRLLKTSNGYPFSGVLEMNETSHLSEKEYQDGILDGKSIKRSLDGSWVEANYRKGKLHGSMTFFDAKGKIRSIMYYENGKLVTPR